MKVPLGPNNKKRRLTLLGLLAVALVAVAIAVPTVVLGQTPPAPPGGAPPPPRSGPGALAPPTPLLLSEDDAAAMARAAKLLESGTVGIVEVRPGLSIASPGFFTRGTTITVAGKQIKLPDDAQYTLATHPGNSVEVPPGTRLIPLPAYAIYRKGESAAVSIETGEYEIQPANVEPFRFLIQALGKEKMLRYNARAWQQAWGEWRQTGKLPDESQLPGPWDLPD